VPEPHAPLPCAPGFSGSLALPGLVEHLSCHAISAAISMDEIGRRVGLSVKALYRQIGRRRAAQQAGVTRA